MFIGQGMRCVHDGVSNFEVLYRGKQLHLYDERMFQCNSSSRRVIALKFSCVM